MPDAIRYPQNDICSHLIAPWSVLTVYIDNRRRREFGCCWQRSLGPSIEVCMNDKGDDRYWQQDQGDQGEMIVQEDN